MVRFSFCRKSSIISEHEALKLPFSQPQQHIPVLLTPDMIAHDSRVIQRILRANTVEYKYFVQFWVRMLVDCGLRENSLYETEWVSTVEDAADKMRTVYQKKFRSTNHENNIPLVDPCHSHILYKYNESNRKPYVKHCLTKCLHNEANRSLYS